MSKREIWLSVAGVLLLALMVYGVYTLGNFEQRAVQPQSNNGVEWRLGYYEGGPYIDYAAGLREIVAGLAEQGWLSPIDLPEFDDHEETAKIWSYLVEHAESPYLEFVPDAYWSAQWDEAQREINREEATQRLAQRQDIDLMIVMGTWGGQDLATDAHEIPTVIFNSSGPVEAGIVESCDDSGLDHIFAECDPYRYIRQIRLFHDLVDFERVGVVYEDSPSGRIYNNVEDLREIAIERNFELFECHAPEVGIPEVQAMRNVYRCYEALAPDIDALWVGVHIGENPDFMPELLAPLFEARVATWAQAGPPAVRRGALLSVSQQNNPALGRWYAKVISQVLGGSEPREIDQIFEPPADIIINLETARRIGFDPPPGLIRAADEIYEEIESGREP